MDITGTIKNIFETQQIKETFKKREFVIEYAENPTYPEFIKFETIQDNTSMLDDFKPGDQVKVFFNLKGREWTNPKGEVVYFNSLQAWRVTPAEGEQSFVPDTGSSEQNADFGSGESDDLPF